MNTPGSVRVILHTHAVAEDRATGKRRRRIDREHRNLEAERTHVTNGRCGQRALACAGRARDANGVCPATFGMGESTDDAGIVTTTFDHRQQAGERTTITASRGGKEHLGVTTALHAQSTATTSVTPIDAVLQNPLHAALECLGGSRTRSARADELDRHDPGVWFHVTQHDVTAVGL